MHCPNLNKIKRNSDVVLCGNHKLCTRDPVCAIQNAFALRKWLKGTEKQVDGEDELDCSTTPFESRFYSSMDNAELRLSMYN